MTDDEVAPVPAESECFSTAFPYSLPLTICEATPVDATGSTNAPPTVVVAEEIAETADKGSSRLLWRAVRLFSKVDGTNTALAVALAAETAC